MLPEMTERTSRPGIYRRGQTYTFVLGYRDLHGNRKQRWVSKDAAGQPLRTIRAADAERARLKARGNIQYARLDRVTLADYSKRWLREREGKVSHSSLMTYRAALLRINESIGHYQVPGLKPMHVRHALESLTGLKPRSVALYRTILSLVLKQAVGDELLARNPVPFAQGPKAARRREVSIPEPRAIQRLVLTADAHGIGALVRFAIMSGMRISELCGLTWRDVDLDVGTVMVRRETTKTDAGNRTLSVGPDAVSLLRRQRNRDGVVALTGSVFGFTTKQAGAAWREARAEAGMPQLHFHDLRHISASLLIELGVDFKVIQERLGHASIKTTLDLYGHLKPKADETAAKLIEGVLRE